MANTLKEVIRTNIYGTEVWVTDKSGSYSANNLGGWGTPNKELGDSALLCIVKRQTPDGEVYLTPLTGQIVHNPAATNSDENSFGFTYASDGHYVASLFRLPVSVNAGTSDLEGNTIANGTYYVADLLLYLKTGGIGVLVEVADYPDLLEDDSVVKVTCETMFYNKLSIKARDYYKKYKDFRIDMSDDSLEWLQKYQAIRADIQGADYTFRSGLKLEAESQVKSALDLYEIEIAA
jgi:hypothetical protein